MFTLYSTDETNYNYYMQDGNSINGPYTFDQLTIYKDKNNIVINELALIQSLDKVLQVDTNGCFLNLYPECLSNFFTSRSNTKIDISSREKIDESAFNQLIEISTAKFFSSHYLYSKELVLTVAISEAALRSQYPKKIEEKLKLKNFDKKIKSFKTLHSKIIDANIPRLNYVKFKDYDLRNAHHLKILADTYSIAIKFYYFDVDNTWKSMFQVPENPEIVPIPIIKLIEYNGIYRILYTEDENSQDGFDQRGNYEGLYSNEEISDSFYIVMFQGFKESCFYDILDILALLGKNDQKSKNTAQSNFDKIHSSIKDRYQTYKTDPISKFTTETYETLMQKLEDADKIFSSNRVAKSEPVRMIGTSNNIQSFENNSKPTFQPPPQPPPPSSNQNVNFQQKNPSGTSFNQNAVMQQRPPSGVNSDRSLLQNPVLQPKVESTTDYRVNTNPNKNFISPPQGFTNLSPVQNSLSGLNISDTRFTQDIKSQGIAEPIKTHQIRSNIDPSFDRSNYTSLSTSINPVRTKTCPSCGRIKILTKFHEQCDMCKACIAYSINDKKCVNCNSNSHEFMRCARLKREEGFKCSACGANKKDVLVNSECMCIVCKDCESKLKLHNYHTYNS